MGDYPDRKRREDCFFGLHFDFHAKPIEGGEIIPVGGNTTKEMIYKIIETVNPDFIQIDCKGHPGWSSFPTKTGNAYPNIVNDQLKVWRVSTSDKAVALFMHYSGVCDDYQCEEHPEWAAKSLEDYRYAKWLPEGITSTFGPYVDEIVIPQLLELAGDYGVDGVWLDGECWGTQVDYNSSVMEIFNKQTGIDVSQNPPQKPGDENWQKYSDFCREQFRIYMRHYTVSVHNKYPDFQIASNWSFSSKMPEPVTVDVDFLSGDYLWADSVNSARYEGRCLAPQGKPWDLMAWGFRWRNGDRREHCPKHPEQLKQEAAVVLALGGGFQNYYPQKKDGSMHMWQVALMKEVAEFCRERQQFCHKAEFIPQVAILNSTYNRYHTSDYLFQCEGEDSALQGTVQLFCESSQSFEILSEHHLSGRMDKYPLIVIPETELLENGFKKELLNYVKSGGSLLLVGTSAYELFKYELNISKDIVEGDYLLSEDDVTWAYNKGKIVKSTYSETSMGSISKLSDIDDGEKFAAAEIITYDKGKIGFIFADIGDIYIKRKSHVHRDLIMKVVSNLYNPTAVVSGSMYIDMTLMQKEDTVMINLVNSAGSHDDQDVYTIDEIPPVGPIVLMVKLDKKPKTVNLIPSHMKVESGWNDNEKLLTVKIPRIDIYEILVID